ncbi:hypothetical protein [Calothrix sp. NIES-3974]|uniref:hypothetical protein n=1 Tax=Calothrix sp. NIES-3974 TaxID=2005462 RepID=UPI0012FDC867|nr:hypothetical protein [Calothrix sp. NIES-3974]
MPHLKSKLNPQLRRYPHDDSASLEMRQNYEKERERAEKFAAYLRQQGIDPDSLV